MSKKVTTMYNWRSMTPEQREYVLRLRKTRRYPWHSPPHNPQGETKRFHVFVACYEHNPVIGLNADRLGTFESTLVDVVRAETELHAWAVLPNHYHLLVTSEDIHGLRAELGQLHGRSSFEWNGEENRRGRKVWFNAVEHGIKSDRHFQASMNYIHNNAVHHRYVGRWQDWPFASAAAFLDAVGQREARRIWDEYPVLDYGKDWDPPGL